jgi:hypothetical protein
LLGDGDALLPRGDIAFAINPGGVNQPMAVFNVEKTEAFRNLLHGKVAGAQLVPSLKGGAKAPQSEGPRSQEESAIPSRRMRTRQSGTSRQEKLQAQLR